jgi:hypothetical protein
VGLAEDQSDRKERRQTRKMARNYRASHLIFAEGCSVSIAACCPETGYLNYTFAAYRFANYHRND